MFEILIIFHIITAVFIIGLILLQHGKGAQTGAAFGSGASTTVFGSQGAGSFLSRTTATLVAIFFIINLSLAMLTNRATKQNDFINLAPVKASLPAKPAGSAPVKAPVSQPVQTQPQSDVPA